MSTNQNSNNMGGVTVNNNISNTPQININNTPGWVKIVSTVAVLLVSILAGAYWYFTITITATNKLDAPPSVPGTPVSQEVPSP
ncbi:MAG: hypothetical protein LBF50_09060, partial [Azoarcus sp.]|nr:hypothetical protein [Azoarcus sp.]